MENLMSQIFAVPLAILVLFQDWINFLAPKLKLAEKIFERFLSGQ